MITMNEQRESTHNNLPTAYSEVAPHTVSAIPDVQLYIF